MDPQLIRQLFPNASKSLFEANARGPELRSEGPADKGTTIDAVRPQLEPSAATRAPRPKRTKAQNPKRFLVRITSVRGRLIDEDNLCEKYVVDCCRYAGLLPGDGPGQTKIETAQRKVGEGEEEHTVVEVFEISEP